VSGRRSGLAADGGAAGRGCPPWAGCPGRYGHDRSDGARHGRVLDRL